MAKRFLTTVLVDDESRPLFPPSKNRSARIRKKLIKRHGGEFAKKRAMVSLPESVMAKLQELV